MEGISQAHQETSTSGGLTLPRGCQWIKALANKFNAKVMEIARKARQLGKEDPRRVYHSLKMGLALTLVTVFYYFKPVYDYGENAVWAVLTVVLVLEFSVGATFGKGLNRMFATLAGGALALGTHRLATLSGKTGEAILISTFVFITAAIATFMKFFPNLKARYDYGLTIFLMTYCLVSVLGYRDDQVLDMAHERLTTIIIGSCIAIFVCVCIYPVWVGEDLHNSVANNMEKLGNYLEGFGDAYFKVSDGEPQSNSTNSFLQGYKSVLTSKTSQETMANLAKWEPGHGRFRFRHPWKNYLKVGNLTRECAYKIEALNSDLNSNIQTPTEIRSKIQESCTKISIESSKALKELASTIKKMTRARIADLHIASSKTAAEVLKNQLKTSLWEEAEVLRILPVASVAYILLEIVECTDKIAGAVYELADKASFKPMDATMFHRGAVQPVANNNVDASLDHTIITVAE